MAKKKEPDKHIIAQNRKARHDYTIVDTVTAGLQLVGSEVKSLREGRGNLKDGYVIEKDNEFWLIHIHIPEYKSAGQFNHDPERPRKLLLHRREIDKWQGKIQKAGMTIVPLTIFFDGRGWVKVEIALAKGKTNIDRRETIKQRDWQRQKDRVLKNQ